MTRNKHEMLKWELSLESFQHPETGGFLRQKF